MSREEYKRLKELVNNTPFNALNKLKESISVSLYDVRIKKACIEDIDDRLNRVGNIENAMSVESELRSGEL